MTTDPTIPGFSTADLEAERARFEAETADLVREAQEATQDLESPATDDTPTIH